MIHLSAAERHDPAGEVNLHDPRQVTDYIIGLMRGYYGHHWHEDILEKAVIDAAAAYRGDYSGLLQCDTLYHDLRHAYDTGVATARLLSGLNIARRNAGTSFIEADYFLLTVILAIYHDIGLLRRQGEEHIWGATLTPVHEERGIAFLHRYLASTELAGLSDHAEMIMLTKLNFSLPAEWTEPWRTLACLIATADILSQSADRHYLEKCRDFLFLEFSAFGLAGKPDTPYPDRATLLTKTPQFHAGLIRQRLEEEYGGAHHYLELHFNGKNPYHRSIRENLDHLEKMLESGDFSSMRRTPKVFIGLDARR